MKWYSWRVKVITNEPRKQEYCCHVDSVWMSTDWLCESESSESNHHLHLILSLCVLTWRAFLFWAPVPPRGGCKSQDFVVGGAVNLNSVMLTDIPFILSTTFKSMLSPLRSNVQCSTSSDLIRGDIDYIRTKFVSCRWNLIFWTCSIFFYP